MKRFLKKTYCLLNSLFETIISGLSIIVFSSFSVSRRISKFRSEKLIDVHILVNGPSLKIMLDEHLNFLKSHDILAVNFFGINSVFSQIKPKYYVLLDPGFFGAEINKEISANIPNLFETLSKKVNWPMILFIPEIRGLSIEIIRKRINNPNIQILPFCSTRVVGIKSFRNWAYKYNLGIPSSKNVLLPSILLMLNRGYKNIYLYGAEFSWTKTYSVNPDNGRIYTDDTHFYDSTRIPLKKGQFKFDLACLKESLDATDYIADYANFIGSKVINRTPGSFIDAFPYENPKHIIFS